MLPYLRFISKDSVTPLICLSISFFLVNCPYTVQKPSGQHQNKRLRSRDPKDMKEMVLRTMHGPKLSLTSTYGFWDKKNMGMVQSRVAASSAAWGWQSSESSATIPKSFGFEAATRYGASNQCYSEYDLFEPCQNM